LRHHSCTDYLAAGAKPGLYEVLRNEARVDDAIVHDPKTGLDVLPASATEQPEIDVLTSPAMQKLLRRVRDDYDLVILESPPVLPVAESRAMAAMADATVLIVRWRTTPIEVAQKAVNLLNRADARIVGAVLARVSLTWSAMGSLGEDVYYYKSYPAKAA
jgi:Mrp family chromosome partitioning ATPase